MIAYWGSDGIAQRIRDLGTRWRRVVSFTPPATLPPGKDALVPVGWEAGWAPEPFWT